jgi:hypothetical protein
MGWAGEKMNAYRVLVERDQWEDLDVDGNIMLK